MYKVWQYRFPKDGRSSRLNEPAVLAELGFLYDGTETSLIHNCCQILAIVIHSIIMRSSF
jgi:hypothetical protein